jgi:hydrogenase nickel incorporation protein HypA/HybF
MHELAICQSILRQVVDMSAPHHPADVARVTLRIGPLAGVNPALLRTAFPLAAAGTCCETASLRIETVAVRVACRLCGAASHVRPNRLLCGVCGTWRVTLLSGDEMRLESLDLRAPAPAEAAMNV